MKKEGPRHLQPGLGMPPLPGRGWGGFSKNLLSENPSPLLVKKKKKKKKLKNLPRLHLGSVREHWIQILASQLTRGKMLRLSLASVFSYVEWG